MTIASPSIDQRSLAFWGAVLGWLALAFHSTAESFPAPSASDHWAFQPIVRPALPQVDDEAWCRNEIDRFVLAALEARHWLPAQDASPPALLRRVYLDLIGLPPNLEEQSTAHHLSKHGAWSDLIDDLLARPAYGERWARHWLDLARYADSNGYERDAAKPFVWRYRDYVIRSLNTDKPMDRFIVEQMAGDELPETTAETIIATGFHRLGHWDDEPADPATDRFDQLDDIIRTTSEVFLGLTLACARCHDHKFEPLSARDYYSMLAIFNPLQRPRHGRTELTLAAGSQAEIEAVANRDRRIASLSKQIASLREEFTRDFLNSDQCHLPQALAEAWLTAPGQRSAPQKQLLADTDAHLRSTVEDAMPTDLRVKLSALEDALNTTRAQTPDLVQAYILHEPTKSPPPTYLLARGSPHQPQEEVEPAVPAVLAMHEKPWPAPKTSARTTQRRLTFARWLVSPDNPLTARVLVNRVWKQHFGVGLVRTPSDFGVMGESPTHPELLDWLAHWFVHDARWSLKRLHRLILTSRAWQMSRTPRAPSYQEEDPDNRGLSHLPLQRLEIEVIRDSMLAVAGQLNNAMFGPSMFPIVPNQALEANTDKQSIWTASSPEERSRRTVYAFIKRGLVVPMLEVMDFADTVHSCPQRTTTTVAPQALTLFNGEFANEQAAHFAQRLLREAGPRFAEQVTLAWQLALGRPPADAELASMRVFLEKETAQARREASLNSEAARHQALVQLCRVVFNLNEFAYPD